MTDIVRLTTVYRIRVGLWLTDNRDQAEGKTRAELVDLVRDNVPDSPEGLNYAHIRPIVEELGITPAYKAGGYGNIAARLAELEEQVAELKSAVFPVE